MSILKTVISRTCGLISANSSAIGASFAGNRKVHDLRQMIEEVKERKTMAKLELEPEQVQLELLNSKTNKWKPGNGHFVTEKIYKEMIDGVQYDELPTAHFDCTRNNTKAWFTMEGKEGQTIIHDRTAGMVGYKNAKKSTNAAAQTVGYQIGRMMFKRKLPNIRVEMKGLGTLNKIPALRGLLLGGVNIVSISDKTYPFFYARPKHVQRK